MKRFNFRFIFLCSGLISLVMLYLIIGIKIWSSPQERTGADFIAFYAAGIISRNQGPSHVYDISLQKSVEEELVGFSLVANQVLVFNHDPYLIPIVSLFINNDYTLSFIKWVLFLCLIATLSASILAECDKGVSGNKVFTIFAILTFFPLFISLLNGQDTVFILLGLSLCLFGLVKNKDWVIGMGLALATIRPQIALILSFPFLFKRQKVFGYFLAGVLVLGLMSFLILGLDGMKGYLSIMRISVEGGWYGIKENVMVNLIGLLWRLFPELGTQSIHWMGWAAYGISTIGLAILWFINREIGIKYFGLAILISLFVSPHLHYHDLALLLVPVTAVVMNLETKKYLKLHNAALLPLGLSLVLLFSSLVPILKYNFTFLIIILITLLLWRPEWVMFWRKKEDEIVP